MVAGVTALALLQPATTKAAFSGTNGKIAFAKDVPFGSSSQLDIVAVDEHGAGFVNITNTPGPSTYQSEREPAWSPDGTRLAFVSGPSPSHIWIINADGSGRRQITFNAPLFGEGDHSPSWSPDGQRIFFSRDLEPGDTYTRPCPRDFCEEIFSVKPDGSGLIQITHDTANQTDPEVSPEGDKIAFTKTPACVPPTFPPGSGCPGGIYLMNPDGTGEAALTSRGYDPSWSPGGRKLAFTGDGIYTMNRDGTDVSRVPFDAGSPFIIEDQPVWSPDGRRIAFTYHRNSFLSSAGSEIFTVDADGTELLQLTSDEVNDFDPSWQPIPNRSPDCSGARSDPSVLLPANRMFTLIFVSGVEDPDEDPVIITIDGVTQDEPVRSSGDPTAPDAISGSAPHSVQLRAERNPHGDGRVYKVAFTASDNRGRTCSGTVAVSVPRHTKADAVESAPPAFDSFGS